MKSYMKKKDALLTSFESMEIAKENLRSIKGGGPYWVTRVSTPTGLFAVKYYEDSPPGLMDATGQSVDWQEATSAGDVG